MSAPIIQINNVTAAYGQQTVLENINLTVYEHDYLGIIGPNGGGKTTLMKLILGLLKPTEGSIHFFKNNQPCLHINMGYLPQYNDIDHDFPISVSEVVLSGLCRKKSLWHPFNHSLHQQVNDTLCAMELDKLKERPIGTLSGGQLQRVLLARAVVSKPDVILLDEPNTYIDQQFQEQMYEMLTSINRQCAIIIVSHDIAEIINNVQHVACVNRHLHYHNSTDIPKDKLEEHFKHIL